MAGMTELEATARAGTGKGAARAARRNGYVPGVIYGGAEPPQTISVKYNALLKMLKKGRFMSTLHNVKVDGVDNRVVCRAVQKDVVMDTPVHIDFQRLSDTSRIKLYVPVEFENHGASPGLKRGGTLNVARHEVELHVTAGDIPEKITVDLTGTQLNDVIKISAVTLPAGVSPVIDRDFTIASIAVPAGFAETEDEAAG
jgi:large subunit ribosomal protein L25